MHENQSKNIKHKINQEFVKLINSYKRLLWVNQISPTEETKKSIIEVRKSIKKIFIQIKELVYPVNRDGQPKPNDTMAAIQAMQDQQQQQQMTALLATIQQNNNAISSMTNPSTWQYIKYGTIIFGVAAGVCIVVVGGCYVYFKLIPSMPSYFKTMFSSSKTPIIGAINKDIEEKLEKQAQRIESMSGSVAEMQSAFKNVTDQTQSVANNTQEQVALMKSMVDKFVSPRRKSREELMVMTRLLSAGRKDQEKIKNAIIDLVNDNTNLRKEFDFICERLGFLENLVARVVKKNQTPSDKIKKFHTKQNHLREQSILARRSFDSLTEENPEEIHALIDLDKALEKIIQKQTHNKDSDSDDDYEY